MMRITVLLLPLAVIGASAARGETPAEYLERAEALYRQGDYEASGQSYEKAFAMKPAPALHYYNAACSWSLAERPDKAFAMLDMTVERGFRRLDLLVEDEDLQPLHGDPRWDEVAAKCKEAREAYLQSINVELYEMFQADQKDRQGPIDWKAVNKRDTDRRHRALEMIEAGDLAAPDDFIHAAFIFQHGGDSTSYRTAHDLAMKAVALDSTSIRARWIAAAAKDRYLQSVGRPQIYGTQAKLVDGLWTLEPIDTTAVTDAERARWGVPPLARQRAWAEGLNDDPDSGDDSDH
jgi:hypothetical protein